MVDSPKVVIEIANCATFSLLPPQRSLHAKIARRVHHGRGLSTARSIIATPRTLKKGGKLAKHAGGCFRQGHGPEQRVRCRRTEARARLPRWRRTAEVKAGNRFFDGPVKDNKAMSCSGSEPAMSAGLSTLNYLVELIGSAGGIAAGRVVPRLTQQQLELVGQDDRIPAQQPRQGRPWCAARCASTWRRIRMANSAGSSAARRPEK